MPTRPAGRRSHPGRPSRCCGGDLGVVGICLKGDQAAIGRQRPAQPDRAVAASVPNSRIVRAPSALASRFSSLPWAARPGSPAARPPRSPAEPRPAHRRAAPAARRRTSTSSTPAGSRRLRTEQPLHDQHVSPLRRAARADVHASERFGQGCAEHLVPAPRWRRRRCTRRSPNTGAVAVGGEARPADNLVVGFGDQKRKPLSLDPPGEVFGDARRGLKVDPRCASATL